MEHGTNGPIRTCCGCRQRDVQGSLVRVTVVDGRLVPDVTRRRGGRGAYLHPHPGCWNSFVRGKGYVRSLRRRVTPAERQQLGAALLVTFDREKAAANHGG